MNRVTAVLATAVLLLASGCSGEQDSPSAATEETASSAGSPTADETTSPPAEPEGPEYVELDQSDLEGALLGIEDLPAGYSQDPPSPDTDKTFCDYKVPVKEDVKVSRGFTKGGGMSFELVSVTLRQFSSARDAARSFDALTDALGTCRGEVYDGSRLEYAPMSAPDLGDGSVGVRITSEGATVLQNFVLVGPTLVAAGGAGVVSVDGDQVVDVVEAQVAKYEAAATS